MKQLLLTCCATFAILIIRAQQYIPQGVPGVTGLTNSNIYQDANAQIGIGTTNPASLLNVSFVPSMIGGEFLPSYSVLAEYGVLGSNAAVPYFVGQRDKYTLDFGTLTFNSSITDFMVNGLGQVGIGTGNITHTNGQPDLVIQDHGYVTAYDYFNTITALDDNGNPIFGLHNIGSSTQSAGMTILVGNANVTGPGAGLVSAALDVTDGSNTLNGPILAALGQGIISIGATAAIAQVDMYPNVYIPGASMYYLFHAGGPAAAPDYFSIHNDGYVGIGGLNDGQALTEISDQGSNLSTTSGLPQLLVDDGTPSHIKFFVKDNSVGIGMDPAAATLAMKGSSGTYLKMFESGGSNWDDVIEFNTSGGTERHLIFDDNITGGATYGDLTLWPRWDLYGGTSGPGTVRVVGNMQIDVNESVGGNVAVGGTVRIGTQQAGAGLTDAQFPNYSLSVDGQIVGKELIVQVSSWSDTVFSDAYRLQPLTEVKSYVQQNHHLPEVPNEREVMQQGVNVGQMNATLLKKIEELTLYSIQQQQQIDELKEEVKRIIK